MGFFASLASSSSGNAYLLSDGGQTILIDAGISCARIRAGLSRFDLTPQDLSAILITHEHSDHVNGLRVLLGRTSADVYLTHGTNSMLGLNGRAAPYTAGEAFDIGNIHISSFATPHDARESVGFRFDTPSFSLGFATDMGYMPFEGEQMLAGVDMAVLESNYDRDMLNFGPYPYYLKQRISSMRGHQENGDCGSVAVRLVGNGTTHIMLAHLSRNNNTPALAEQTVGQTLAEAGIKIGGDMRLTVAPPDEPCAAAHFGEVPTCGG